MELACRSLLRGAGVPLPRREYGHADVPPRLAERGITCRETAVLALLARRLSSAEIGERLFISPRTVDKHIERLLHKTGTARRAELATWWAAVGT
ncbi:MAG: transcriptional regulator, LuxR family [Pseudonocardia sp.]|jgi:DNA-binding CsgD family transcriptional regulator|nr:transcriptional regulator, LuxR family [Pseudonocardia sp.]MDT7613656.1 hypothetical protein [Pseudonocardiales bacterium]